MWLDLKWPAFKFKIKATWNYKLQIRNLSHVLAGNFYKLKTFIITLINFTNKLVTDMNE